jgi:glycosyltransferase involved in cell wall biosynthesis
MKFTIVTPSLNQGAFIDRTLRSIHAQRCDVDVEHLVVDGGSSDGTLDVLRRYEGHLSWTSGPDQGQSDAINQGLRRATGDILAWLNSDDVYEPGALAAVAEAYRSRPFQWAFGNCRIVDESDREIRRAITAYKIRQSRAYSFRRLLRRDFIPQPAVFFTREAFEQTGALDVGLHYSMDYDYWLRLGRRWTPCHIDRLLAGFRWHTQSKNGSAYRDAARESFGTAQRHAQPGEEWDLFMHRLHVLTLVVLYRFL